MFVNVNGLLCECNEIGVGSTRVATAVAMTADSSSKGPGRLLVDVARVPDVRRRCCARIAFEPNTNPPDHISHDELRQFRPHNAHVHVLAYLF